MRLKSWNLTFVVLMLLGACSDGASDTDPVADMGQDTALDTEPGEDPDVGVDPDDATSDSAPDLDAADDVAPDADVAGDTSADGDADPDVDTPPQLDGPPDAPAMDHLPELVFPALEDEDFGFNPALGITTSNAHLLLTVAPDATVGQVNDALAQAEVTLAGTMQGPGILFVTLGDVAWDQYEARRQALENHPAISTAVEDALLEGDAIPSTPFEQSYWDQGQTPSTPHAQSWHLDYVAAPSAWNLIPWLEARETERVPVAIVDSDSFPHHDDIIWRIREPSDLVRRCADLDVAEGMRDGPCRPKTSQTRCDQGLTCLTNQVCVGGGPRPAGDAGGPCLEDETCNGLLACISGSSHGLHVSSLIGANRNGFGVTGISPFVNMYAINVDERASGDDDEDQEEYLERYVAWSELLTSIVRATGRPRARVINVSQGYGWSKRCFGPDAEGCDPTGAYAGSECEHDDVQRHIAGAGQTARRTIDNLNEERPVFIVTSAGNSSGTPDQVCNADGDLGTCTTRTACRRPDGVPVTFDAAALDCPGDTMGCCDRKPCRFDTKLGLLPTRWNSPLSWLSVEGYDHVLAVEAVALGEEGAQYPRASFSNVDSGGVLAPGEAVQVSRAGRDAGPVNGTSFAAPIVAGIAAWLLAIDPELENAALRELLSEGSSSMPRRFRGETNTQNVVNMLLATQGLALHNDDLELYERLVDMDDGTLDGFTRVAYGPNGENDGPFQGASPADGIVDMSDFRRLRDTVLLQDHQDGYPDANGSPLMLDGDLNDFVADLNGDFLSPNERAAAGRAEPYARGTATTAAFMSDPDGIWLDPDTERLTQGPNLDVLRRFFESDNNGVIWGRNTCPI